MKLSPRIVSIACFGEILWDCLPRGIFLGGAPLNVAYHLARHRVRAVPVSAVGKDFLGEEARRRIEAWGVETRFIGIRSGSRTGTVGALLDRAGVPTYRIARSVAWDRIEVVAALARVAPAPAAIVFGTLALRENENRRALSRLLKLRPDAWRVADLNLRAPFDRPDAIAFALERAQFVKVNDDELARLTGRRGGSSSALQRAAREFAARHQLPCICVTAGSRGAGLLWEGEWFWENGRPVKVRDTIGAGDAFLGGFLAAVLAQRTSPAEALRRACRMGEFVAARDGATPPYRIGVRGGPVDAPA